MISSEDVVLGLRLCDALGCETGVWRREDGSRSGPGVRERSGMLSPRPPSLWMSSSRLLMSVRSLSGGSAASRVRGVVSSGSSLPSCCPPPPSPAPPPTPPPCSRGAAGPPLQRPLSPISRITSPPARGDHQHMGVLPALSGPGRPSGGGAPSPAGEGGGRCCGHHRARRPPLHTPSALITTHHHHHHTHSLIPRPDHNSRHPCDAASTNYVCVPCAEHRGDDLYVSLLLCFHEFTCNQNIINRETFQSHIAVPFPVHTLGRRPPHTTHLNAHPTTASLHPQYNPCLTAPSRGESL